MKTEGISSIPKLGGIIREKRDQRSFVFYMILLSLQFVVSFIGVEISLFFRLVVLVLLFLSLVRNPQWLPFVLTVFWGTSLLSPLPFLPTDKFYIFVFTIGIWIFNFGNCNRRIKQLFLVLVLYFLIIAFITIEPTLDFTSPLFLLIPIALAVATFVNDEDDILRLVLALMLMSLFLATLFLLKRDDFAQAYKTIGLDRSGWTNANQFGGGIAVGLVCAVAYFLKAFQLNRNFVFSFIAITTILVTIPTSILNASRGSLLAVLSASIFLLLFSKVKILYKILVTILVVGFAVYLYSSGIFELLEARIGEENLETGGGRLTIWKAKFDAFKDCGALSWVFGIGQPRLRYLGVFYSSHNDFVTAIIGYGFIGLVLFLSFLFSPFIMAKSCKREVSILTIFLLIEGMVLEPIFRGLLPFYMYYIILYKYALLSRKRIIT